MATATALVGVVGFSDRYSDRVLYIACSLIREGPNTMMLVGSSIPLFLEDYDSIRRRNSQLHQLKSSFY